MKKLIFESCGKYKFTICPYCRRSEVMTIYRQGGKIIGKCSYCCNEFVVSECKCKTGY